MIGFDHPGTSLGIFLQIIASLNTVPPRMLRIVPLGDFHIFFKLNSGVIVKGIIYHYSLALQLLLVPRPCSICSKLIIKQILETKVSKRILVFNFDSQFCFPSQLYYIVN